MIFNKKALIIIILLFFLLLIPLSVHAATITLDEVSLSPKINGYNASGVYIAPDENIFVVDDLNELWKIEPVSGAYSKFLIGGYNLADIVITPEGNLWWSDNAMNFGFLDMKTNQIHFASIDTSQFTEPPQPLNIGPITYYDSTVWLASWAVTNYGLFGVTGTDICLYEFPVGLFAADLIELGGIIWGIDWDHESLFRFDPVSHDLKFIEYEGNIGQYSNMQSDENFIWWIEDAVDGKIFRFDIITESLVSFSLPSGSHPRNIFIKGGIIWYTDTTGGFGRLDPDLSIADTMELSKVNAEIRTHVCKTVDFFNYPIPPSIGIFDWGEVDSTVTSPQVGLEYYSLPSESEPFGVGISSNNVWVSDRGRQKLIKMQLEVDYKIFLPLLTK